MPLTALKALETNDVKFELPWPPMDSDVARRAATRGLFVFTTDAATAWAGAAAAVLVLDAAALGVEADSTIEPRLGGVATDARRVESILPVPLAPVTDPIRPLMRSCCCSCCC